MTDIEIPELAKKVSATHIGLRPKYIIWSKVNKSQTCVKIKGFIITSLIGLLTVILFVPAVFFGFIGGYDTFMNVLLVELESSDFMQRQTGTAQAMLFSIVVTTLVPLIYVYLIKEFMTIVCKRESWLKD